ncbi:MAG TPA: riboflavin synthase [Streptosporangiaceae bacterium]|nr:riboflavin synthase [Streptosporangiaceae bacterium]
MFTGIVEELGEIAGVEELAGAARLSIRAPRVSAGAAAGDSIAVNGICLTVTDVTDAGFRADVMGETLRRTALGGLAAGSPVNLERPLRLDDRLGGHLVQGHVDGTGVMTSRTPGEHWDMVRIEVPAALARYIVEKGSVAVDGVSLTVSATGPVDEGPPGMAEREWFEVSLIPTTLRMTTFGTLQPASAVNIEVDVVAKYVEKLTAAGPRPATPDADYITGARS